VRRMSTTLDRPATVDEAQLQAQFDATIAA
jgi:hypothetical protein